MNQHRAIEKVIKKLGGALSEPLGVISYKTKAPIFMILTQMLSVICMAVQQLVDISPKIGMTIPVSLYVLTLAASGERKSTVDKLLMKPVREFEKWLIVQTDKAQETYRTELDLWNMKLKVLNKALNEMLIIEGDEPTELIERWRAHHYSKPIPPVDRRILIEDVTGAKLKSMLGGNNTSLALVSDEAGTLLSSDLIKDNSLFCSLWSGQSIRVDRANSTVINIEGARLTLSMQVQPHVYKAVRTRNGEAMRSSGLDARFLFCEPESEIGYRFEDGDDDQSYEDSLILDKFNSRIDTLLKQGLEYRLQEKSRHCLKLTDRAMDIWHHKYNEIEYQMRVAGDLENYRDFGSKFMEQASRIAAVLHVFNNENYSEICVSHEIMDTAIQLAEIYLQEAMMVFREPGNDEFVDNKHANALLEWIFQNWKNEWYLKSEIRRSGPYCVRDLARLEDAIEVLIARGDIFCFKKKQSMYLSLSWDKYPRYVRNASSLTRHGYRVKDLTPYFGRYKSRVPSRNILMRSILKTL